ncbi:MAG: AMP-binding protein [Carboxylicivirga sp.]|jgi:D-alanine--poly(phosphoribitol) ligase subunit 1|nr:AMP-binding protein [Carboxylicivirga sp.]
MDIISQFCLQVEDKPNNIAIVENGNQIEYLQLKRLAYGFANAFSKVSDNPKILIFLPQSINAYASMIGTLMAGGYYCPININLPSLKIQGIVKQFKPDIIVTSKNLDVFNAFQGASSILYAEEIKKKNNYDIRKPHLLSYIIFTSGSTGVPKGVMIKRKAVSKFVEEFKKITNVNENDKWGQFSSIGFDLSVVDLYTCLSAGATLYPITEGKDRILPAYTIQKYQLTIWHSVPSIIDLMERSKQISRDYLSSLKLMSFCGEPLYPKQIAKLFDANNSMKIFNTYGPTEATLFCTVQELNSKNYHQFCNSTVSIGQAISGWNLHLENTKGYDEIIISGENIGVGYLNNKEETNKRYKKYKVNKSELSAFYTGDTAYSKDDNLYFNGRIDNQVKISGNRVELGDIDSAIRNFGISQCCTVFHNNKLYAFIDKNSTYDELELVEFLRERLSNFQIPQEFIRISSFPKNINDKIDRNKLVKHIEDEQYKNA